MPQTAQASLLAQLPPQILADSDEKAKFFVGWWLRVHQRRNPLIVASIKFVEWAEDGAAAQRFVWEVCRWPERHSSSWAFVCWMVDGAGMWMKLFPSKQAAMAYFAQAPAAVNVPSSQSTDGSPSQGVKLRRVS